MVAGVRVGGGRGERVVGDMGDVLNQMVALPMVGRLRRISCWVIDIGNFVSSAAVHVSTRGP